MFYEPRVLFSYLFDFYSKAVLLEMDLSDLLLDYRTLAREYRWIKKDHPTIGLELIRAFMEDKAEADMPGLTNQTAFEEVNNNAYHGDTFWTRVQNEKEFNASCYFKNPPDTGWLFEQIRDALSEELDLIDGSRLPAATHEWCERRIQWDGAHCRYEILEDIRVTHYMRHVHQSKRYKPC
jgi:hypothetical protein